MVGKKKGLFLTHQNALRSKVTGGVQLCSQEFHNVISEVKDLSLFDYYVPFTRRFTQRILIRLGLENYSMFNVKADTADLSRFIAENQIDVVFINMASLLRYAKPIKQKFQDRVKVILLSHGNHSGDFVHSITNNTLQPYTIGRWLSRIRLGLLITTESQFRKRYIDAVLSISETEQHLENWLGARKSIFIPRMLGADFLDHKPVPGRIGFVGRLDHPPNKEGIEILFKSMMAKNIDGIECRLVGAPLNDGVAMAHKYPFVKYLGELSDSELEKEAATWALFLNPVWWYSTGATTKLGKAIGWGLPIITTTQGSRGYVWTNGQLLVADTPAEMADIIRRVSVDHQQINYWSAQTRTVAVSGLPLEEIAGRVTASLN